MKKWDKDKGFFPIKKKTKVKKKKKNQLNVKDREKKKKKGDVAKRDIYIYLWSDKDNNLKCYEYSIFFFFKGQHLPLIIIQGYYIFRITKIRRYVIRFMWVK